MNDIAKNIKKLRCGKNMTQEELAQRIVVTRQAVSNWENGRTEPDVDMLSSIASVFGVELEELIYGEKRETNKRDTSAYRKTAIISGVLAAALIIALFALSPMIKQQAAAYDMHLRALQGFLLLPAAAASSSLCLVSAFSVKFDIHIKNSIARKIVLALGLLSAAVCVLFCLSYFMSGVSFISLREFIFLHPAVHAVPAVLIFLGLMKS